VTIDLTLLPKRALVDSSVLVLGLGPASVADPRAPACRAFFDAMEKNGRTLLIAAPSLTEYLKGQGRRDLPRRVGIVTVGFDDRAAVLLATMFPAKVLNDRKAAAGGLSGGYIKYDAMIVACAVRHRADHFVSIDRAQSSFASSAGLTVRQPGDYEQRQQVIQYPPVKARA
jgi:predicted nucleic acid-binding protein